MLKCLLRSDWLIIYLSHSNCVFFSEQVFPALDIMRVALRNEKVNEHFCNSKDGPEFLQTLVKFVDAEQPPTNRMLALRAIANLSCHKDGEDLLLANCEDLLPLFSAACATTNKNIEIAASTVLLNLAVLLKHTDEIESKAQLISVLATCAKVVADPEARFRICVALGTIVWKDDNSTAIAQSLEIGRVLENWAHSCEQGKLQECASGVSNLL